MPVAIRCQGVTWPTRALATSARALLRHLGLPKAELSVLVCDDVFIRALNAQWRQKDEPTDVLSFAMGEGEDADLNEELLGDVVISLDTATRQAAAEGHDVAAELRVLLVHGVLHLCGLDHIEPEDAAEMRAKEAECLAAIGGGRGLVDRATGENGA